MPSLNITRHPAVWIRSPVVRFNCTSTHTQHLVNKLPSHERTRTQTLTHTHTHTFTHTLTNTQIHKEFPDLQWTRRPPSQEKSYYSCRSEGQGSAQLMLVNCFILPSCFVSIFTQWVVHRYPGNLVSYYDRHCHLFSSPLKKQIEQKIALNSEVCVCEKNLYAWPMENGQPVKVWSHILFNTSLTTLTSLVSVCRHTPLEGWAKTT